MTSLFLRTTLMFGKESTLAVKMNDTYLELIEGDITELEVDAIVNPTASNLKMVDELAIVILEKGGKTIQDECKRIKKSEVGTAVMTGAGLMENIKQVIHAVPPVTGEGDEDRKLASAVRSALALADRNGLRTIAIPEMVGERNNYPLAKCARTTLTEVHRYLQGGTKLERVIVTLGSNDNYQLYRRELRRGFR